MLIQNKILLSKTAFYLNLVFKTVFIYYSIYSIFYTYFNINVHMFERCKRIF